MGKKIQDVVNELQAGDPTADSAAATIAQVKILILEALQAGVTIDQVAQQVAETVAEYQTGIDQKLLSFITQDQLVQSYLNPIGEQLREFRSQLDSLVTADQVTRMIAVAVEGLAPIHAVLDTTTGDIAVPAPAKGPIDEKYLAGLKYRSSRPRKGGAGDDDATVHVPTERDLTPADVLDWAFVGDLVSFVTADGQAVKLPK
jgi:hypothetical protein